MKLKKACEIAHACGLETIGEALFNIELHAMSIFDYTEINKELNELYKEAKPYHDTTSIYDIISQEINDEIMA